MAENSKIEWTDHTFNPWEGCQKVGPGCDHCYAEARNARFGGGTAVNWGPGAPRRRTSAANWRKPLAWNAAHAEFFAEHGRRQRAFCASLADVFDNAVDSSWRADLFQLIEKTPHLDWLLLTKRIGIVGSWMALYGLPSNVWLGISIVNQAEADRDIPKLLEVPAKVRFLSMEPLLGPVCLDWSGHRVSSPGSHIAGVIDWVIVGGESGHQARPMHPDWARRLRDQCAEAGVPFLFKQFGEWAPSVSVSIGRDPDIYLCTDGRTGTEEEALANGGAWKGVWKVGKKSAGRLLDGVQHDGYPEAAL